MTTVTSDAIVAYGFKNLTPGHTYWLWRITADNSVIEDGRGITVTTGATQVTGKLINYQSIGPSAHPVSFLNDAGQLRVAAKGPGGSNAIKITVPSTGSTQFRKSLGVSRVLASTGITSTLTTPYKQFFVDDSSSFVAGSLVDIVDDSVYSPSLLYRAAVASVDSNSITLSEASPRVFGSATANGGVVQESSNYLMKTLSNSTAIDIFIVDPQAGGLVTFYLESSLGGRLEWDIVPMTSWLSINKVYFGEAALLSMYALNSEGLPLPNDTEIQLWVDGAPGIPTPPTVTPPIPLPPGVSIPVGGTRIPLG